MTTFSKTFRTAIVALSTVAFTLPQTVWAGGHPGGGMGGGMSGASSHSMTTSMRNTTSSSNPTLSYSDGMSNKIQSQTYLNAPQGGTGTGPRPLHPLKIDSSSISSLTPKSNESKTTSGQSSFISGVHRGIEAGSATVPGQVREDDYFGSLGTSILDDINCIATFVATNNGGDLDPSTPDGSGSSNQASVNQLTNGSGGQYQDGTPEENPVKGNGTPSGNPNAGSAAGSAMGASASSSGSSNTSTTNMQIVQNSKDVVGTVPTAYGNKSTGRGLTKDSNASANLAAQGHTQIAGTKAKLPNVSSTGSGSTSTNPSVPSYPVGPIFGGGSSDDTTPVTTTDSTPTTPDSTTTTTDSTPATTTPVASDATATTSASGIDLVLEDVTLAGPATLVAGPAYTVKFRNQGTADAGKFQVGIFAGFTGKLASDAPRAAVEVPALAAGEVKQVTLRLPQKAMKLTGVDGKPTAFTRLFIGLDLNNTVTETDKTNNTAVVDRAALETTAEN
jgi:CARDB